LFDFIPIAHSPPNFPGFHVYPLLETGIFSAFSLCARSASCRGVGVELIHQAEEKHANDSSESRGNIIRLI
jgi:hypothetical protein